MQPQQRGIVVTPRIDFDGPRFSTRGSVDLEPLLRPYLLYWDKIEYPSNNIFEFGDTEGIRLLKDEGILSRTRVEFKSFSGSAAIAPVLSQIEVFKRLEQAQPGAWALVQQSTGLYIPPDACVPSRGILVELYDALPVPAYDTPLAEILDFKQRRRDQLGSFRSAMDELYEVIISSADVPHARTNAIDQIETSLRELHRVTSERFSSRFLSSLKIELNVPALAVAAGGGATLCQQFSINPLVGAALGTIATAIKFDLGLSSRLPVADSTAAFAYVLSAQREFG